MSPGALGSCLPLERVRFSSVVDDRLARGTRRNAPAQEQLQRSKESTCSQTTKNSSTKHYKKAKKKARLPSACGTFLWVSAGLAPRWKTGVSWPLSHRGPLVPVSAVPRLGDSPFPECPSDLLSGWRVSRGPVHRPQDLCSPKPKAKPLHFALAGRDQKVHRQAPEGQWDDLIGFPWLAPVTA